MKYDYLVVGAGLYGAVCMGGTVVYDIEHWPMLRASLIHYLLCILLFPPIALFMGWSTDLLELLIVIGIMTVVYAVIGLIMYLIYRAQVRELNEINRQRNELQEKTDADGSRSA